MSAVAGSSMRIDLYKAAMASAAGLLCAMSGNTATPINSVSVATLQASLAANGQALSYTAP
jgi:hypothetical protein